MSEQCNLTEPERSAVFGRFLPAPTAEEEEQMKPFFTKYLVYSGKGRVKKCYCTECGTFEADGGPWKHNIYAT